MNRDNLKRKIIKDASGTDNNNFGFVLGIISAVLLIVCIGTLLMFNHKQVQRIIGENINIDPENSLNETQTTGTLLTKKTLNVRAVLYSHNDWRRGGEGKRG